MGFHLIYYVARRCLWRPVRSCAVHRLCGWCTSYESLPYADVCRGSELFSLGLWLASSHRRAILWLWQECYFLGQLYGLVLKQRTQILIDVHKSSQVTYLYGTVHITDAHYTDYTFASNQGLGCQSSLALIFPALHMRTSHTSRPGVLGQHAKPLGLQLIRK